MRRFRPELLVGKKVRLPGLRPALTKRLTAEASVWLTRFGTAT